MSVFIWELKVEHIAWPLTHFWALQISWYYSTSIRVFGQRIHLKIINYSLLILPWPWQGHFCTNSDTSIDLIWVDLALFGLTIFYMVYYQHLISLVEWLFVLNSYNRQFCHFHSLSKISIQWILERSKQISKCQMFYFSFNFRPNFHVWNIVRDTGSSANQVDLLFHRLVHIPLNLFS